MFHGGCLPRRLESASASRRVVLQRSSRSSDVESSLERSPPLHVESLIRRSESSKCFTASLFLAGLNRLVLPGELFFAGRIVLPRPSLVSIAFLFAETLFFAGRSRLGVSLRVSSSYDRVVEFFTLSRSSQVELIFLGRI